MSWDGIATPTLIPLMDVQPTQRVRNVDTKGLLIRKEICFDKELRIGKWKMSNTIFLLGVILICNKEFPWWAITYS